MTLALWIIGTIAAPLAVSLLLQRAFGDIPVFDFMTELTRPTSEVPLEALLPEGGGS